MVEGTCPLAARTSCTGGMRGAGRGTTWSHSIIVEASVIRTGTGTSDKDSLAVYSVILTSEVMVNLCNPYLRSSVSGNEISEHLRMNRQQYLMMPLKDWFQIVTNTNDSVL